MITLNGVYQYIGRTNGVKALGGNYYYYILLYAKTISDPYTGKHTVSVKMRLACNSKYSFYGYYTNGAAAIDGASAIAWLKQKKPGMAWNATDLTEAGHTYPRWIDLAEGSVEVDTASAEKEVTVTTSWQRATRLSSPPDYLPSTTTATVSIKVLLEAIEKAEQDLTPDQDITPAVPDGVMIYADGVLVCDSRLEDHDLARLQATHGLNVGGTAEITLPLGHPAYNRFVSHKTIVEIYRNGRLKFRGRALYPSTTFYGMRTITCEGELCLLRDSVQRPNVYEMTPQACFAALINQHNQQVEPEKRFVVGLVTVVDPDGQIALEIESAKKTFDVLKKLIESCGGYIVFTSSPDGSRLINWLADLTVHSNQRIEFGENLLDFSSTGANTAELATGLVPYGAKDAKTKKRITIEAVNNGKDYIVAEDAVAIRGTIFDTATWDDVTDPNILLQKAWELLKERKVFITSLELTALDLSYLDRSLDSFAVGDIIRVFSDPHGVNEDFQLIQLTEDFINPAKSKIVLGKDIASLTGSDVAGDNRNQSEIDAVKVQYNTDASKIASSVLDQAALLYTPLGTTDELLQRIAALEAKI